MVQPLVVGRAEHALGAVDVGAPSSGVAIGCPQSVAGGAVRLEVADLGALPLAHRAPPRPRARRRSRAASALTKPSSTSRRTRSRVALRRVAVAAAARHEDLHLVAVAQGHAGELRRRHRPELLDERPPLVLPGAAHPEPADRALAAAEHAPRLGLHPVQQRAHGHLGHGHGEDPLAAEAAAELARAAGVRRRAGTTRSGTPGSASRTPRPACCGSCR